MRKDRGGKHIILAVRSLRASEEEAYYRAGFDAHRVKAFITKEILHSGLAILPPLYPRKSCTTTPVIARNQPNKINA